MFTSMSLQGSHSMFETTSGLFNRRCVDFDWAIDWPQPRQMDILLLSPRKLRLLKNPKSETGEDDFVLCGECCLRSATSIFALSVWPSPTGKSLHAMRFVGFNQPKNLVPLLKRP